MHMKNPHLFVFHSIQRVFNIKILPPPWESVIYLLNRNGDVVSRPVRKSKIGHYTSQSLDGLVLELSAKFTPILAILVENDTTLIIQLAVFKSSLYFKSKVIGQLGIQDRGFVILESIVGPLPVVGVRLSRYLNEVFLYAVFFGLVQPFQFVICEFFSHL